MELLTKDKVIELLSANKLLLEEIAKIIGYGRFYFNPPNLFWIIFK